MQRILPLAFLMTLSLAAQSYDLVLANGRVLDPESGMDAMANIGVIRGKIVAIGSNPMYGRTNLDVHGLVVAPGFIDLHSHGQTPENYAFKARDGVTTALELEVGVSPVKPWYAAREGKSLVNFGATVGHIPARMAVMGDTGAFLPRDKAVTEKATPRQIAQTFDLIRKGLDDGALGIGLGIAYIPTATREEILDLFQLAAGRKAVIYVHMRNSGPQEPGAIDSTQEIVADAAATGASVHIVHLTSTCLRETPVALRFIKGAAARKLDVTTEAYPYTAGMTDIASAIFDPGWQHRLGEISYGDLQWAATGERLTAESFERYRKHGGMVAIHGIPEEMARLAMADPDVIVASDGILENGKGHPRAAGTYARVLGRYVREQHALNLMDAIRKMTLLPAQRLALTNKGRIKIGADADLTVFDPARVIDKATFENPAQYSEGIPFVVVNGVPVVYNSKIEPEVFPGQGIHH